MFYFIQRACAQTARTTIVKVPVALSLSALSFFSIQSFLAKPAEAAAFAESSGDFSFAGFSTRPFSTNSSVFTDTVTVGNGTGSGTRNGTGSGADAIATADALFESLPSAQAVNEISSLAFSLESPSSAFAESEASVIGRFAIAPESTFRFDFSGALDLATVVDRPTDSASAVLETRYALFNDTGNDSAESENLAALDFFSLFGEINTPTGQDSFAINRSDAVTVTERSVLNDSGLAQTEESLSVAVNGRYERFFADSASLTLVELKQGAAFTKSPGNPTEVPDASSPLVWLVGIGGVLLLSQRRPRMLQEYRAIPIRVRMED